MVLISIRQIMLSPKNIFGFSEGFYMSSFKQQTDSTCVQNMILPRAIPMFFVLVGMMSLSACQSIPTTQTTPIQTSPVSIVTTTMIQEPILNDSNDVDEYADDSIANADDYEDDDDYSIEPYIPTETVSPPDATIELASSTMSIDDDDVFTADDYATSPIPIQQPTPSPPKLPSRDELLRQARQNSQQPTRQTTSNNVNLPAFRNLMQVGVNQLRDGQLTAAENSFTRAQRMAPRSSAVYFYLSQVALKKKQPRKAEAMARRGLNVSQDASRHRALWQLVLQSGQMQNSQRVIREAQQALR